MNLQEILKARLKKLEISRYELAKRVAIARDPSKSATALTSTIDNAMGDPKTRRFSIIEEIVRELDGEIVIHWRDENGDLYPASIDLERKLWELEKRVEDLEKKG